MVFRRIERAGVDSGGISLVGLHKENEMLVIRQELRPQIGTLVFRGIQLQDELRALQRTGGPVSSRIVHSR